MSWIKTAVNKAVEVGGNNQLTRTVTSYAGSVVQHAASAVAGGAKMFPGRIGSRSLKSFRLTAKLLEDVSISCRGVERIQLLRRWLVALKEIERLSNDQNANNNIISDGPGNDDKHADDQFSFEELKDSPNLGYYFDPEIGEPMNFKEVFLYSQALEGMTLSMILEAPNEEEVSVFLEILRICIAGGKEVHETVMNRIKSLAMAFSDYKDEVMIKREELLQYAQAAIAGLKINADLARIDAEACSLKEKLGVMGGLLNSSSDGHEESSEKQTADVIEALENALEHVRLYSRLETLLIKKISLSNGDSPQHHAEKVEKLKVLSESLLNSTSKAEKFMKEQRVQKEEALSYSISKTNEIIQYEKELMDGIQELERQKYEIEAELEKVNASLSAVSARLNHVMEDKEHCDKASNEAILHLNIKEEEISNSVTSCRVEADVVNLLINFLEDTWVIQINYKEQKEKQVNAELERFGEYFVNMVIHLLSAYKKQLGTSMSRFRQLTENLRSWRTAKDPSQCDAQRKYVEEEYLSLESKFSTTLSVVDSMKIQFYSVNEGMQWKNDQSLKELFDSLRSIKVEFESIERPTLEVEIPKQESPSGDNSLKNTWLQLRNDAEQMELNFELENDDGESSEFDIDEIGEWEYDAFEKDPKSSN